MSMAQNVKHNRQLKVTAAVLVVVIAVGSAVLASAAGFDDYKPPASLNIQWFDYLKNSGGSPSPGNAVTNYPRWSVQYPYRAVFFGGRKNNSAYASQKHDSYVYIVFSKVPVTDAFRFTYTETKSTYQTGYILAEADPQVVKPVDVPVDEADIRILYHKWTGIESDANDIQVWAFVTWTDTKFYFDFWYKCEPHGSGNGRLLQIDGLGSIDYVPYPYILTCNASGSSPSSSSGTGQPPGSSSSSSGGGESSEPGGGESSDPGGGESSNPGGGSSGGDLFPPGSQEGKGDVGDTGETGGGWSLPGWRDEGVSGEAGGFVELVPGGDGSWGPVELVPGGDGSWGPVELTPGGDGSWGYEDWGSGDLSQGLYDFMGGFS